MVSARRGRSPGRAVTDVCWLAMPLQFLQGMQSFLIAKDVSEILQMKLQWQRKQHLLWALYTGPL